MRIPASGLPLLVAVTLPAQQPPPAEPAPDRPVRSIEILHRGGARPAWSVQGDSIAFDEAGADGRYDLHVLDVDSHSTRCLTCELYDLRKKHNLSPSWHPSGDYIVFIGQSLSRRLGLTMADLVTPDRGAHGDLFVVRTDGKDFWQMAPSGGALLDPHFSFEGDRLVWSERLGTSKGSRWGEWSLRIAQFRSGKVPRLGKVRSLQPGEQKGLVISHGFTPNDRSILVSGNLASGQGEAGSDIFLADVESHATQRLTHSRQSWDVHAHISPNGRHIAWTSNAEIRPAGTSSLPSYLYRDLWLMNRDGSDKQRLTFFNDRSSEEGLAHAYVGDFAWSPRGDQIVIHVMSGDEPQEALYLIQLDEGFRR